MIKRVEINYRGIFQKTLAKRIGSDLVLIAARMGQVAFSNGRYSDSPERNGIPCKYFTFISPDLEEEELEAECGAKMDIDEANISVVLDDTMVKGVEPWGWSGIRAINEKMIEGGAMLVVTRKSAQDLLKFIPSRPFSFNLVTLAGDASLAGLWVFKDDLTHERVLGTIAGIDPSIIRIDAVEAHLRAKTKDENRVAAAREAFEAVKSHMYMVQLGEGADWNHEVPKLPGWDHFREGTVIPAVPRHFEMGPRGQSRNPTFKRGTTKTQRPVVRFDLCTKCTLCWVECPDQCFDPTDDGYYDIDYEYCVGCGKCAEVCPVEECIIMADELVFDNYDSPWEHWKRDADDYLGWTADKKGNERVSYPFVTGTGRIATQVSNVPGVGEIRPRKETPQPV